MDVILNWYPASLAIRYSLGPLGSPPDTSVIYRLNLPAGITSAPKDDLYINQTKRYTSLLYVTEHLDMSKIKCLEWFSEKMYFALDTLLCFQLYSTTYVAVCIPMYTIFVTIYTIYVTIVKCIISIQYGVNTVIIINGPCIILSYWISYYQNYFLATVLGVDKVVHKRKITLIVITQSKRFIARLAKRKPIMRSIIIS